MILSFPSVDLSGGQGAIRTASLDAHLFESVAIIGTVNLVLHLIGALLLVTAVARRLHDRERSGWGALSQPVAGGAGGLDQARRTEERAKAMRAEEDTSELQSLMRRWEAGGGWKKKKQEQNE